MLIWGSSIPEELFFLMPWDNGPRERRVERHCSPSTRSCTLHTWSLGEKWRSLDVFSLGENWNIAKCGEQDEFGDLFR